MLELVLLLSIAVGVWAGVLVLLAINTRIPGVNEPDYLPERACTFSIRCKGCEERTPTYELEDDLCPRCKEELEEQG